MTEEN